MNQLKREAKVDFREQINIEGLLYMRNIQKLQHEDWMLMIKEDIDL